MKTKTFGADNEWSPLKTVIVGRAENSLFPSEPKRMLDATMPPEYRSEFFPHHPFPADHLANANEELDNFARVLEREGVEVLRPDSVDWNKVGGYTGAMPRDGLMVVGDTVIEAPFSWQCRKNEISLAYSSILDELARRGAKIVRAPRPPEPDTIYGPDPPIAPWAINNSRPAFDTADFMRIGKTILGQYSNVTNEKGVEYLRSVIPPGYKVEMLHTADTSAMHIDTSLIPLRPGLAVYWDLLFSEEQLRRHDCFDGWELVALPFRPKASQNPPRYMVHDSIVANVLVLDGRKVFVEEGDSQMKEFLVSLGMEPIPLPFRHIWGIGGSFHCATTDVFRIDEASELPEVEAEEKETVREKAKDGRNCLGALWSMLSWERKIALEGEDEWPEKM